MMTSHDALQSWCWQLQPVILQETKRIGFWGEQISNSDFPAAARFPVIVGVSMCMQSGADGDDGDGDHSTTRTLTT